MCGLLTTLLLFAVAPVVAQDLLQSGQFRVTWQAGISGSLLPARDPEADDGAASVMAHAAAYSSDSTVLYWLFNPQNPEGMFRVLDGRGVNGHWWVSMSVFTDLPTLWTIEHTGTGAAWLLWTGRYGDLFPNVPREQLPEALLPVLALCYRPADDVWHARMCANLGSPTVSPGVTLAPDAWAADGTIPRQYYFEEWCRRFTYIPCPEGSVGNGSTARLPLFFDGAETGLFGGRGDVNEP